jgi:hypothetical protein
MVQWPLMRVCIVLVQVFFEILVWFHSPRTLVARISPFGREEWHVALL